MIAPAETTSGGSSRTSAGNASVSIEPAAPAGRLGRVTTAFLRVPLFWKLTVANAAIALLVYGLGIFVGGRVDAGVGAASLVGIVGSGLVLAAGGGILLNALLVHLALSPIHELEEVSQRVEAGELDVRVGPSPLADRELSALMSGFDQMLDTLARTRVRQKRMASRILESEERTRQRIARQLYDDIGQRVASVLIRIPGAWRADDAQSRDELLEGVRDELAETLERIRASARRLHPPELDDLGLVAAVRAEVRTVHEEGRVSVELDAPAHLPPSSRNASLTFFRVLQEALFLAGESGSGRPVRVALDDVDGRLHGRVRQRGVEFAEALADPPEGLADIEELGERAGYVEGFTTVGTRGRESILTIEIPRGRPSGSPPDRGADGRKVADRSGVAAGGHGKQT